MRQSDPYTPQQNGLAERFNWTIIESIRTIIKDSSLSCRLWNEVAQVSCLTLNQIPVSRNKKSPFEAFKNRTLPLTYFKPIGCPVTYLLPSHEQKGKFDQKGMIGRFLGYNEDNQSYKIWTHDRKIVRTKSIKLLNFDTRIEDQMHIDKDNDEQEIIFQRIKETDDDDSETGGLLSFPLFSLRFSIS
jgi:hypothetical protein